MGWFDGYPFVSKEERERRNKEFEKRLVPLGLEQQRDYARRTLAELLPKLDNRDAMFAFFDAKDAYVKNEKGDAGYAAAAVRLKKLKWIGARQLKLLLTFIQMESEIDSLEQYPTAAQITGRAFPEETL